MADDTGLQFKKFVTENEIEEKRKERQEEWDKVRKPDDPIGKYLFESAKPLLYNTNIG